MTATVLPGSDGQACWRFTITDGQHKNRQFLTATGRPRLAAATLALIEMEYRLEIEMAIPYYYQFLLRWVSIIVNPTSVVSTYKPCQGPYPSYAIAITSRDNQNHRTMERRDYDVTKETHNMARSIVSSY